MINTADLYDFTHSIAGSWLAGFSYPRQLFCIMYS